MPTLDQLAPGQAAVIEEVGDEDGPLHQRLLEMGLLEGERVEFLAVAPLGDPIEIRIRSYQLSLRRREARAIRVSLDAPIETTHPNS